MQFWAAYILNGLAFAMLLFLLAGGFTLIFGVMKIFNLAQGSFYLLAAYVGLSVVRATGNFFLAVLAGSLTAALIGVLLQRAFLSRFQGQVLPQVLLTYGFLIIFSDAALWVWGGHPQLLPGPPELQGSLALGEVVFPKYRLAIIAVGLALAALLYWFHEKTRYGAVLRAAVDDEEMVRGLGVNTSVLFSLVFGLGAFLGGVSGVIAGPFIGVYPGADFEVLLLAAIIVIVGGMGSLKGALLASTSVGIVDNLGKALFPQLSMFLLFLVMITVLVLRPRGLFGRV